jgi:hypothetical protein
VRSTLQWPSVCVGYKPYPPGANDAAYIVATSVTKKSFIGGFSPGDDGIVVT